ncbi:hypothetical protein DAPPUDRAFT_115299 [Daphnia pulex]|uniref:CIDE-N domain-containing protein n=1 Tax=Daphnia pulex TaxID=6669 RepID=E9HKX1_DAPPU|nr:hypothetical protein DAPPUDRAFT_115299 [Daphnia pulex]|eukprot:EFX67620.1 hypothetical protein DAPPUDRAFT_115299 [Daphnia pulex]
MDVMSKQVVKLLNFSQKNSKVKMICVSSLDELLLKGATAFALNGICEIVTSSEEILSDDEVLFMLNSQSQFLYIRLSQSENDGQQSNETVKEAGHQSIIEAGQQSKETGQENNEVEQQSNGTGQENNEAGQESNMATCFPVDDILIQGRIGVKRDTAIEIIDRLKAVDYPKSRCLDKDHFFLVKATGTWLMKNCEKRENFPTFNEILKMAKSIVSFFPSAGSFNTESPRDLFFYDKTRKGSLESYMRGKRTRKQLSDKRSNKRPKTVFLCPEGDSYTEDEIREAEEFMRFTQLDSNDTRNPNCSEMLRLMKVRDEFFRLKGSTLETFASNWRKAECKIIEFCKQKFTKSLAVLDILRKAEEAEENFDIPGRMKCVLKLTLHAAANTQPSQNKKGSTADGWNLLYQSFNYRAIYYAVSQGQSTTPYLKVTVLRSTLMAFSIAPSHLLPMQLHPGLRHTLQ